MQMENLRQRLSRRLRELMRANVALDTQVKVAQKSGVSQSTVQRILAQEQAATVDVIESLAHAFGVKYPQQFLLDSEELKLLSEWQRLSAAERAAVLGFIAVNASGKPVAAPSALEFDTVDTAPPDMMAATGRAAGRKPAPPIIDTKDGHQRQARKRGNGHPE